MLSNFQGDRRFALIDNARCLAVEMAISQGSLCRVLESGIAGNPITPGCLDEPRYISGVTVQIIRIPATL